MAKGALAKVVIENKIKDIFGNDYIGNYGGKIYLWADDGGNRIQVSLSLTCPKVYVEEETKTTSNDDLPPWELPQTVAPAPKSTTEITEEEQSNIKKMLESLGL